MYFSDFRRKTLITVDEETSTARIESYNVHLLATLRRTSGREGVICLADFFDFGVYILPKDMVSVVAQQTYINMLEGSYTEISERKKISDYKIKNRKFGGKKCRK